MRNGHLWQDLGLFNRGELSRLLATHFPTLAAGNTQNMKWKKPFIANSARPRVFRYAPRRAAGNAVISKAASAREKVKADTFTSSSRCPATLPPLPIRTKALVYGLLFRATAETLRTIAADPKHLGAEIGFFAVLHSWGQNLLHHPHLHCVVAGGGLSADGDRRVACKPGFCCPSGCSRAYSDDC